MQEETLEEMQLQAAKEILCEIFNIKGFEVDEMIKDRLLNDTQITSYQVVIKPPIEKIKKLRKIYVRKIKSILQGVVKNTKWTDKPRFHHSWDEMKVREPTEMTNK